LRCIRLWVSEPEVRAMILSDSKFYAEESAKELAELWVVGHRHVICQDFISGCLVKTIVSLATGETHIEHRSLVAQGIRLITLKHAFFKKYLDSIKSTSQLAIYHLLHYCRAGQVTHYQGKVSLELRVRGREVNKLKIGLIGLGRVGSHIAAALSGLGCEGVTFYDPLVMFGESQQSKLGISLVKASSVEEVLNACDIVFLAANERADKLPILDHEVAVRVSSIVSIINIARASLVSPEFLYSLANRNLLGFFGTDVFWDEANCLKSEQILDQLASKLVPISVSPHIGGFTTDALVVLGDALWKFLEIEYQNE